MGRKRYKPAEIVGERRQAEVLHDCLQGLRWLYGRRNIQEARQDRAAWLTKWQET